MLPPDPDFMRPFTRDAKGFGMSFMKCIIQKAAGEPVHVISWVAFEVLASASRISNCRNLRCFQKGGRTNGRTASTLEPAPRQRHKIQHLRTSGSPVKEILQEKTCQFRGS